MTGTTATHALSAKARSQPGNADQTNKASRPDTQYQRPNQSSNNYAKSSPPTTPTRRPYECPGAKTTIHLLRRQNNARANCGKPLPQHTFSGHCAAFFIPNRRIVKREPY